MGRGDNVHKLCSTTKMTNGDYRNEAGEKY